MKNIQDPIDYIIEPTTWEKRYDIHKYWGKKPSNVIAEYIKYFTNEGDTIVDVFSGYGVTTIEAVVNSRIGIGIDINPISKYIVESMLRYVDIKELKKSFHEIEKSISKEIQWLYSTKCPECGDECKIVSTIWENNVPLEIKYICKQCKSKGLKKIEQDDLMKIDEIGRIQIKYWYPNDVVFNGWETKKLHRAGLQYFSDIFTHRNLYALSMLFDKIVKVEDETIRQILLVTFTSMIAQASKMIANYKNNSGGPSWKINTYWLPGNWQELNVWHYFENRFKKMLKGKEETNELIGDKNDKYKFYLKTSTNLVNEIANNSVDYIFTDPPYGGEGIQYLELSFIWNAWLKFFDEKIDWENEVVFNPYRDTPLDNKHYEQQLTQVFREAYRILKDNAWMTVTFANKDIEIWNSLIRAFRESGFELVNIIPMEASAPNITQMLLKETSKTDLLINLRKSNNQLQLRSHIIDFNLHDKIEEIADRIISKSGKVSLNEVFDHLLIDWFSLKYSHENFDEQIIDFDKTLIQNYFNNNNKYKEFICDDSNTLRRKADTEWTLSEIKQQK